MEEPAGTIFSVSKRLLFWIHVIVPLLLVVFLADIFLLDGVLRPYLQITTTSLALYLLFFDLPHILASFVSYADPAYITHYRNKLFGAALIVVGALVLYSYDPVMLYAGYITYTMWHVIRQQTGLSGMMLQLSGAVHQTWSLLAIILFTSGYFLMYANFGARFLDESMLELIMHTAAATFLAITGIYAYRIKERASEGFLYFTLTTAVVCAGYIFIVAGYPFLAILVVRFVHDITAFVFYAVHDHNRNIAYAYNYLYRLIRPLKIPFIVTTPLIGIGLAWVIRNESILVGYASVSIILLGLIHYYLEGSMWKRTSLHRRQITFTS